MVLEGPRAWMFTNAARNVPIIFVFAKPRVYSSWRVNVPPCPRPVALRHPSITSFRMASLIILSFLEGAQGSFQTLNDPEAINPPNSLGRQVNCCRTSISLRKPSPPAHPPAQKSDLYGIHSVCRPNYRWLRNGEAPDWCAHSGWCILFFFRAESSTYGLLEKA